MKKPTKNTIAELVRLNGYLTLALVFAVVPWQSAFSEIFLHKSNAIQQTGAARQESAEQESDRLTLEDYRAFAENAIERVREGVPSQMDPLTNWGSFLDKVLDPIPDSNPAKENYRNRFLERARGDGALLGPMHSNFVSSGSDVTVLQLNRTENGAEMLCRLVFRNDHASYFRFYLQPDGSGNIRIVDSFVFSTGLRFSDVMQRFPIALAARHDPGIIDTLDEHSRLLLEYDSRLKSISELTRNAAYTEAISVYHELPVEVQNDRAVILLWITAAKLAGNEQEMSLARVRLQELFGSEDWAAYNRLILCLDSREYEEAWTAVEDLDAALGGDNYLDYYRAAIKHRSGDIDSGNVDSGNVDSENIDSENIAQAYQYAEKLIEAEPTLSGGHWMKLTIALGENNHDMVLSALKGINKFQGSGPETDGDEDFDAFRESPQYRQWQEFLNRR